MNKKELFCYTFVTIVTLTSLVLAKEHYLDHFYKGHAYEDIKNYRQAEFHYQQAIKLEPGFANGYNALGFVYLEMKEYKQARQFLNKSLELKPDSILPLMNIGASYYREKNYQQAKKYFQKVLNIDSRNAQALTNMAATYYRLGKRFTAYKYYKKAKKADENYLKERYNKEKSLAEIRQLRKNDPENVQLKIIEEKIINNEIFIP